MITACVRLSLLLVVLIAPAAVGREEGWVVLSEQLSSEVWDTPTGAWYVAGDAKLDPENEKQLAGLPGSGVIINGPTGRTSNLSTRESFGDVEFHCEFLVPKNSNSGVKFEGLYEIQIMDSWGLEVARAQDCGGIYPRAELLPKYRYLDEGHAPMVNASRPPGEWQSLDATFLAPKFDAEGKKTHNARIVSATLNGQLIHQNLELETPTGHAWTRKNLRKVRCCCRPTMARSPSAM